MKAITDDSVPKKRIDIETESDGRQHHETGEGFATKLRLDTVHGVDFDPDYIYLRRQKGDQYGFQRELKLQRTKSDLRQFMNDIINDYGQYITRLRDTYKAWQKYLNDDADKKDHFDKGVLKASWISEQGIQSVDDMFQIRTFNDIALDKQLEILVDAIIENFYETQLKFNCFIDIFYLGIIPQFFLLNIK